MLHEIFLSLSGIPSPFLQTINVNDRDTDSQDVSYACHMSEPERDMLKILAGLSDLQVKVKELSVSVSTSHSSPVCSAISTSIRTTHLQAFTDRVIGVECSVLQNDSAYVGAYKSIPLSTLVTEFQPWLRPLHWLLKTLQFLSSARSTSTVFKYLNRECQTGYNDLRDTATSLLIIAEKAWINCLMPWFLFGELPRSGKDEFMISVNIINKEAEFSVSGDHVPYFVSDTAVESLLAIGKAISQIRSKKWQQAASNASSDSLAQLQPFVLEQVKSLSYPITVNDFDQVVESVNSRLYETTLTQFLPADMIIELLTIAKQFLLLQDNEFAATLVKQAAQYLQLQSMTVTSKPVRKLGRFENLNISETDLSTILGNTWSELSANTLYDTIWSNAIAWIRLTSDSVITPINTLLPTPAGMKLHLPSESPLHMFISVTDIGKYTDISAYLASINCAKAQIVDLWSKPDLRRRTQTTLVQRNRKALRLREDHRARLIRPHWTCANQIILLLSELSAYLHGEVIESSWSEFQAWFSEERDSRPSSSRFSSRPTTASSRAFRTSLADRDAHPLKANIRSTHRRSDPRILARAHRAFLDTLYRTLLLTSKNYVSILRDLLNSTNHFVALFHRLQIAWQGLDQQQDHLIMDPLSDYSKEERELLDELNRTRSSINDTTHDLISSIRDVEKQRDVTNLGNTVAEISLQDTGDFRPWTARSLDRLLMKLDSLAGDEKEELYEDAIVGDEA